MKKYLLSIYAVLLLSGCTQEQQNKLERLGVTWLEGDYKVTYAVDGHVRSWVVHDAKVTSEPSKGYYYFWARNEAGKKYYVQTPIARTYIEEIIN